MIHIKRKFWTFILLATAITLIFVVPVIASEHEPSNVRSHVSELHDLMAQLITERQAVNNFSSDLLSDENIRSMDVVSIITARSALLLEFDALLRDASLIRNRASSHPDAPMSPINLIGVPYRNMSVDSSFVVGFTDEVYFELIDLILEFTGIDRESLDVRVTPPISFCVR